MQVVMPKKNGESQKREEDVSSARTARRVYEKPTLLKAGAFAEKTRDNLPGWGFDFYLSRSYG